MSLPQVTLTALSGVPEIRPGDDLVRVILEALTATSFQLQDGDVVIVTQKIVSKAEGCFVELAHVVPSARAERVAAEVNKDPKLVEVILSEGPNIVRRRSGVLIVETHHGWICANAGVDRSNVTLRRQEIAEEEIAGQQVALTLPKDPDASAHRIREGLIAATETEIAVIITDTYGRPWRLGTVNFAIGVAGMKPILDMRGQPDRAGYPLRVTTVARADELAAAAGLLSGQAAEGLPVVIVRGAHYPRGDGRATDLQRPEKRDLFR